MQIVDEFATKVADAVKCSIRRMHKETGWSSEETWTVQVAVAGGVLGFRVGQCEGLSTYARDVLIEECNKLGLELELGGYREIEMQELELKCGGLGCVDELATKIAEAVKRSIQRTGGDLGVAVVEDVLGLMIRCDEAEKVLEEEYSKLLEEMEEQLSVSELGELGLKLELRGNVCPGGKIRLRANLRSWEYSYSASEEWLLTEKEFFGGDARKLVKEFVEEHRNKLASRLTLKEKVMLELDRLAEHVAAQR